MTNENNDEKFVSDLYQSTEKPEASTKTDEAILEYARHRVASQNKSKSFLSQRNRWLSVAASVVLVSLIFVSQRQDFTPQGLQSDAETSLPESLPEEKLTKVEPAADFVSELADKTPTTQSAARKAPMLSESAELLQVTGSRSKATDSGIKIECRYSVDGSNPLSSSPLAKYIADLAYRDKQALAIAVNSQIPLTQMGEQSETLMKLAIMPGFEEQYQLMAAQVKSCMSATGPARE
ncbi:hypothetical protein MACH26_35630 [Planctobacterium marinum]|uniref:Uncharacterized protein n=2 Tax=Planctobacterium marinum TaxID=1631968 RepID=A0AA48KTC3_9ALTE|nr:hypothetical protein MACH26_35630 [Planctobacterium marinum]